MPVPAPSTLRVTRPDRPLAHPVADAGEGSRADGPGAPTPPTLRRFTADDFAAYRAWFGDAELARRLGPMDDAWLDHVLAEVDGLQYVALVDGTMVAVTGVLVPVPGRPWGAVTDLAVDPARRGAGIGRAVLRALLARRELRHVAAWRAWVEADNAAGCAVLAAAGWSRAGTDDGMVEFRLSGRGVAAAAR